MLAESQRNRSVKFSPFSLTGGRVVTIGLARSTRPVDGLFDLAGMAQHAVLRRRYGFWEHTAPMVWPPAHSYAAARRAARSTLPGCRWRRLPMWRYCVTWTKPDLDSARL